MPNPPMTSHLTAERLAELRAIAETATPGPWQNGIDDLEGVVAPSNPGLGNVVCIPPRKNMGASLQAWPANAKHIAAFDPPTTLALLADRERLEAEKMSLASEHLAYAQAAEARIAALEDLARISEAALRHLLNAQPGGTYRETVLEEARVALRLLRTALAARDGARP